MFSDKKTKVTNHATSERNIIGNNTVFTGDITSDGDFRIDGTVDGTIKTKGRVILGKNGIVSGNVQCANADVEGTIVGTLSVDQLLTLKQTANIQGDVTMDKLSVEPGAVFNVNCTMKGGVKSLNQNENKKAGKTA